jgi:hypothetical protein
MGWSYSPDAVKSAEWKPSWNMICRKTTAEMGTHQKGLLIIAAKCKRMEETNRGKGYLEVNCLKRPRADVHSHPI